MDVKNFFKKIFNGDGSKDPVCGMSVDLVKAAFKSNYKDKTYGFCTSTCKETFDKNPENFAS